MNNNIEEHMLIVINILFFAIITLVVLWFFKKRKVYVYSALTMFIVFIGISWMFLKQDIFLEDKMDSNSTTEDNQEVSKQVVLEILNNKQNQSFKGFKSFILMSLKDDYISNQELSVILRLENNQDLKKNLEILIQQEEDMKLISKAFEEQ